MINWLEKFPWAKGTMAVGVGGMALIVLVALFLLAFRQPFPSGYEGLMYSLVGMAGVGGFVGVGKRATDYTLAAIKTGDAATVAAVVGPPRVPNADAPQPTTDPAIVDALQTGALLAEEARLKKGRQAVAEFEEG